MGKRDPNIIHKSNILIWIITPIFFSLWFYILLNKEKEVNVITKDPCDEFANNVWIVANTQSRVFAIDQRNQCDKLTQAILEDINQTAQYLENFLKKKNNLKQSSCNNILCCADLTSVSDPGVFELLYGIESLMSLNLEDRKKAHVKAHQRCHTLMRGGHNAELIYNKTIIEVSQKRQKRCTDNFIQNTESDELLKLFLDNMMTRMKDGNVCALQYFAHNTEYAERGMKEWLKYLKEHN